MASSVKISRRKEEIREAIVEGNSTRSADINFSPRGRVINEEADISSREGVTFLRAKNKCKIHDCSKSTER